MTTCSVTMFGQVDVLVNMASILQDHSMEARPSDGFASRWEAISTTHLSTELDRIRATAAVAKANIRYRPIHRDSGHAPIDSPIAPARAAAEFGIAATAKTPAHVAMPPVQARSPDTTTMRSHTQSDLIRDVLQQTQPTRRPLTTEQIDALAVLLCSSAADRYSLARWRRPDHPRPTDRT